MFKYTYTIVNTFLFTMLIRTYTPSGDQAKDRERKSPQERLTEQIIFIKLVINGTVLDRQKKEFQFSVQEGEYEYKEW